MNCRRKCAARVELVMALGLLGQRAELDEQNVYIHDDDDPANYMLQFLGLGYALLGDMERANEIFRECVRSGQVTIVSEWRVTWKILVPDRESEIDEAFVQAYDAAEQRLRALY